MAKRKQVQPRKGVERALGDAMRRARRRMKISQMRLLSATGLNRGFISAMERGLQNPSLRTIIRVANGIGVHPNDLVQGTLDSPFYVVPVDDSKSREQ
jgi:transcriptional regulator with XRE-family HTH domain